MKGKQHYGNHKQFNTLYYFVLLPLSICFLILSIFFTVQKGILQQSKLEAAYYLVGGLLAIASIIWMRQQAIIYQKRTIRLEMRLRYFILTGRPFNSLENKLSTKQIAALRFASDTELLSLLDVAMEEQLEADQIKKRIKRWKGDYHQV